MNRKLRRAQGKAVSSPPPAAGRNFQGMFGEAIRFHQAGHLAEAERLYRQILAIDARNADALHLIGVIALQRGQPGIAVEMINTAIGVNGNAASYYSNLGNALKELGRLDEAIAAFNTAIRIAHDCVEAHYNLGNALFELKRLDEARTAFVTTLRYRPTFAEAHSNLGNVFRHLGDLDAAIAAYRGAIRVRPDFAEAHSNLGNTLYDLEQPIEGVAACGKAVCLRPDFANALSNLGNALGQAGRSDAAVAAYVRAIRILPDYAEAYSNLGNALSDLERFGDAIVAARTAICLKPDFAKGYSNQGNTLYELGRLDESVTACTRAILIKTDFAGAYSNLGNALKDLGRLSEAVAVCQAALQLKPDLAKAQSNLGNAYYDMGRLEEAIAAYTRAVLVKPDYAEGYSNRGNALKDFGNHDAAVACYRNALRLDPYLVMAHSNLLFCLMHDSNLDPASCRDEHLAFADRFETPLRAGWRPHANDRNPERRLKVGFVSGDLRFHAVANFIEPVWAELSPDIVEVWAYSNYPVEDDVTAHLKTLAHQWRKVVGLNDAALAETIRADGIDILIDLSGHTAFNRLLTFARKPAPVQAAWVGYPGTSGISAIDYLICDPFNAPHGLYEAYYSEHFARLPSVGAFVLDEDAPAVNDLPALTNGYITFASFNRHSKLSDRVIAAWCEVLRAVPNSRLLSHIGDIALVDQLTARFGRHGISADRLRFHPRVPKPEYLALHNDVDIVLDAWPYTGGTTTNHALWMGVPVVTIRGPSRAHCQSAAVMGRMGLNDWVADDVAGFIRIATERARDIEALADLRRGMRQRWLTSPLRQNGVITRGLEAALRIMWRRWCAGLPPENFDVPLAEALGNRVDG
jgi:predicted O-linked N-acetylglucosamine transferase (SPINDLY family)